jgi:coenzyme Q-binding protein COQ10
MPTHTEDRHLPYTASQMYELVADVEKYPEFLPWCSAARVRSREVREKDEVILADLVIKFKAFSEKFGSRVTFHAGSMKIETEYLDGPFKFLKSSWEFIDRDNLGCDVKFFVNFEFKSRLLQKVIGIFFNEAMQRIVRAFEKRANDLYG